ncbi:T9SS type B sorting domain-containing protein [Sediminicola luteus]|uniref:Cadherin domain-containing protein n=1 Tax=Sediminicola luteus TaxID=319238 RepID=A0A2A4GBY6_9FLAO|nr:gliding motility-associated C-terminal domain-containing protein [Sediminicola luteus]PCE66117.1 hypothetical protein B7P33_02115 [Sediminicola luteus]
MNRKISLLGILIFLFSYATVLGQVNMTVTQGPNIDVMVTVGTANVSLLTFEDDLETALNNQGIPLGKLRVEAFERTTISSDQADASDIFNSWNKMDFDGTEPPNRARNSGNYTGDFFSFDSNTNQVSADYVSRRGSVYGVAMYDPTGNISNGIISSTFGLNGAPGQHAEVGFIFRKKDNDNFYAYIIDNHTYCGNLQNYANGDGYPAEAIIKVENGVKTIMAVNTNSTRSGTAPYGWDGNRGDMFAAYYDGQVIDFKIEMNDDTIKISRKGGGGDAGTDWIEVFNITDTTHDSGSYGFYVHEQSGAYFQNIAIEKRKLRAFKNVLQEPQWRNSAMRFNVNLDDLEVADFNNDTDLSEILTRTINEDIHYIGWGTNTNQAQFERFVSQNNNKGTFVNRSQDNYSSWINALAQYIASQYQTGTVTAGDYFIAGTSVEINVTPPEMKTNTANASYPNGRWKIDHNESFFPNDAGKVSWHDQYLEDVPTLYEKPGEYTFSFQDQPTTPTKLFFHRRPMARFTFNAGTGAITNESFDLDGGANNGIAQSVWKWKQVDANSENNWNTGAFNYASAPNGEYLVMLEVQDHQGVWSAPYSIFVEKTGAAPTGSDLPVAQFTMQPDEMKTYTGDSMTASIIDNSYDPYGRTIDQTEWTVTKQTVDNNGDLIETQIYTGATAMTDFSGQNTESADYLVQLRVRTNTGIWSDPYTRTLTINHDPTPPTITALPADGSVTTNDDIQITVKDNFGGSGFDVHRYHLSANSSPAANDSGEWSSWNNTSNPTYAFRSGGNGQYIHIQGRDIAGNVKTSSFGPFNVTLILGAEDDLVLTNEDTVTAPVNVLFNDAYDTSGTPTVSIVSQGSKGNAIVNGSNEVVYTPNANENGTDTITYRIEQAGSSAQAQITVSIEAVDDPPVSNDDTFSVDEGASLNENVATNDVEPDGDTLVYHLVSNPSNAANFTFNNDGTFSYEHDDSETLSDSFTYNFEDANSFSSNATVSLTINPLNDLPTGADASFDAIENITFTVGSSPFNFTDVDPGDTLKGIRIVSIPDSGNLTDTNTLGNGAVVTNLANLRYVPATDAFGAALTSFTFKVIDQVDGESTATYTMTINILEDTDGDGDPDTTDTDDDDDGTPDVDDAFPKDDQEDTDTDGDGTGDNADTDDDDDGTPDVDDAFPKDDQEDTDTDGDGTGDNADTDDDDDGTPDVDDAFPKDDQEDTDTDGDGTGDNADTDDDNDGTPDVDDAFPKDDQEDTDTDGDGTGDNADTDDDDDGTPDVDDAFPKDDQEDTDTDGDGTGDNADTDDDNDGTPDVDDAFPKDDQEDTDTDGDGTGDNADTDDDNDGTPDVDDAFPKDDQEDTDTDGDGTGDNADTDDDDDGTPDSEDAFPKDDQEDTDTDGDGTGDNADTDDDNDGTPDSEDAFPKDDQEDTDTDGDGTGDNADTDDDDDGTPDEDDAFPKDDQEDTDTDGDGTGDNADTDDDNDGTPDIDDAFPKDDQEDTDTDGDGTGDNADTDDDDDGTPDEDDAFPKDDQEDTDTDGDGTGDNADTDDDNDGTPDVDDAFPKDDQEDTDTDGDGTGDNADTDDDNDGTPDVDDAFPKDDQEDTDTDGDGTGDNADSDDDNDGTSDSEDAFPKDDQEDTDTDGDGTGDNADTDDDNDGTSDSEDAFPKDDQEDTDTDGDGTGDNADTDDDNDGTSDSEDAFPKDDQEDTDTDGDGTGDNADNDDDNDGTPDSEDAFPKDDQEDTDTDGDGTGDNADTDDDNDGTPDSDDAFPLDASEDADADNDGTGDNADTDDDNDGTTDTDTDGDNVGDNVDTDDDNDGVPDAEDAFPLDPNEHLDTDGDGTGDNADADDDNDGYSDEIEITHGTDSKDPDSNPLDTDKDGQPDSVDNDDDNDGVADSLDDFPLQKEPSLKPAEAFTPNGDGVNDFWVIPGLDNYPNAKVSVYNRWGHQVFSKINYRGDWNGTFEGKSDKLPAGSYLYVIELGQGKAPQQGWLFINY